MERKIYTKEDVLQNWFKAGMSQGFIKWQRLMDEFRMSNPENTWGSCVIGAGIYVWYKAPRCRRARRLFIIYPSGEQRSRVWESGVADVIEYLKEFGIEAEYASGRLD